MFWDYVLLAYGLTFILLVILTLGIISKNRRTKLMLTQWEYNESKV